MIHNQRIFNNTVVFMLSFIASNTTSGDSFRQLLIGLIVLLYIFSDLDRGEK